MSSPERQHACLARVCRLEYLFERTDCAGGGEEDMALKGWREQVCRDCVAYACAERLDC